MWSIYVRQRDERLSGKAKALAYRRDLCPIPPLNTRSFVDICHGQDELVYPSLSHFDSVRSIDATPERGTLTQEAGYSSTGRTAGTCYNRRMGGSLVFTYRRATCGPFDRHICRHIGFSYMSWYPAHSARQVSATTRLVSVAKMSCQPAASDLMSYPLIAERILVGPARKTVHAARTGPLPRTSFTRTLVFATRNAA
jgi:hypothetical protein